MIRTILAVTILLSVTVASASLARGAEYELWMRSFIPSHHDSNPGYVRPVPGSDGATMVPGPLPISDCFLTDQRDFSMEPSSGTVTSRIAAYIRFDETGRILQREFVPSYSVEVDCEDGEQECRNLVDTSGGSIGDIGFIGTRLRLQIVGKASDACFNGAPNLNFDVTFDIDPASKQVMASGSIDNFPSFEALIRTNGGPMKRIFALPPAPGTSAFGVLTSRPLPSTSADF